MRAHLIPRICRQCIHRFKRTWMLISVVLPIASLLLIVQWYWVPTDGFKKQNVLSSQHLVFNKSVITVDKSGRLNGFKKQNVLPSQQLVFNKSVITVDKSGRLNGFKKQNVLSSQHLVFSKTIVTSDKSGSLSGVKCVLPVLNPFDPVITQLHETVPELNCSSAMEDWVNVINGTLYISRDAIRHNGNITCEYAPVVRKDDFSVAYGSRVKPVVDGMPLQSDFFRVECESSSDIEYKYINVYATVVSNKSVMARLRSYHSSAKSTDPLNEQPKHKSSPLRSSLSSRHKTKKDGSILQTYHNLNLSVFMLGFDSLSRMAWRRFLPKAYKYFIQNLEAIELKTYNIVGDGTPAALLPILTGKTEEELPEAGRGFPGAKPVDNHPWIWKEFSKHGYVTAYAEDLPHIGTFQYRMLGFQNQPTDHYMRPFYLSAEKEDVNNPALCWGTKPRHVNFMNWFGSLLDVYRDFPKFFFGFYSEMSHDDNNVVQAMDDDLVAFLKELERKGHLNSTLMILMADHGARYNDIRSTAQGKVEERLPFFSFRFPPWFRKLHPTIIQNMHINRKRLTTPFDIHATFLDILYYSSTDGGDVQNRSISLFKQIPKERTCTHAEISPHWCACLQWQPVNRSDPLVDQAVSTAIQTINNYTQPERNQCSQLTLYEITKSLLYVSSLNDWTAANVHMYQVSFKTLPGHGHFEVTCEFDVTSRTFIVSPNEISRINKYGSQPACVQDSLPHLRPYCYCV